MYSSLHCLFFVACILSLPTSTSASTPLTDNPVDFGRVTPVRGLTIANIDGRDGDEAVAIVGDGVAIIGGDGKLWPGFPKGLRDATSNKTIQLKGPPALCDLDGDGRLEIAVGGSSRMIYAVNALGDEVSGFPVKVNGNPRGPLSCMPVKGSRRQDLIFSTDVGELTLIPGAGVTPKVLAKIGRGAESGVAVTDLDGDGDLEMVVGGGDSRLYVIDSRGAVRKGFPYGMSFRTSGIPSIGDIDDDGAPDIVFGSQDFKIHALSRDGKLLEGFPVPTKYRIYGGVALADLNGDWVLDLVVGSGDKHLYAFDGRGKEINGFPAKMDERVEKDSVVGDMDRDGSPEIFTVTEAGTLLQHDHRGKAKTPKVAGGGKVVAGPVIGDLDADGSPDLVVATKDGRVVAIEMGASGDAEKAIVSWSMPGHDAKHTGTFAPNPTRFKKVGFVSDKPPTTEALKASYEYFNLDWQKESGTLIRWYRDGKHVSELDNLREVATSWTEKHQKWSYTLQGAANFAAYGDKGKLSQLFTSSKLEVRNTAPTAPVIEQLPTAPLTTADLEVRVKEASTDPDGDKISYRYVWLNDGRMVKPKGEPTKVPAALTKKGEVWRIVVVPYDGEEEGTPTDATVRILNTPPLAAQFVVEPAEPKIDDSVRVKITKPAPDADGDAITYAYRYWVDDKPLSLSRASAAVPPRTLRKHQKVRVEVTAHDDEVAGGKSDTELKVQNTASPAPAIAIWPVDPKTTSTLQLGIVSQEPDADRDPIAYEHQWYVDGAKVAHPTEVPSSATRAGQVWRLEVTPLDGESKGKVSFVETRIINTPPQPPTVLLDRYRYRTDEMIEPRVVVEAHDDDADVVQLHYRWYLAKDTTKPRTTAATLDAKDTKKGQEWLVEVTPNDGKENGQPVSLRFAIENTPPTPPKVEFSNVRPTAKDSVEVKVVTASTDKDGDKLSYRYAWYRDGIRLGSWKADKARLDVGDTGKGQRWRVEVRAFDGETEGDAGMADLLVINHVPAPPSVELTPTTKATTTDTLVCGRPVAGTDPDGDNLTYQVRWFLDGQPIPLSLSGHELPSTMTKTRQTWQCEVTASDGALVSKSIRSKPVLIVNTPPGAATISIAPTAPTTVDDLVCGLEGPSDDPDFDRLSYRFTWWLDGKPWSHKGGDDSVVPHSVTKRDQVWECLVAPSDGEAEGRLVRAKITVQNTAPSSPVLRVLPSTPKANTQLECEIVEPSVDVDSDPITYDFEWFKDGVQKQFAKTSSSVPARLVKANDMWQCRVTPKDGTTSGAAADSPSVTIGKK